MSIRLNRRYVLGGMAAGAVPLATRRTGGAPGAPIAGSWKLTIGRLDNGDELTVHYESTQVGDKLQGRSIHIAAYAYTDIRNGTIDGDRFSFRDAFFDVRGVVKGDMLFIEANYDRLWPYTNVLNPDMIKVPFDWPGN